MNRAGGWLGQVGGGWLEGPGEAVGEGGLVATSGHHSSVPAGGLSDGGGVAFIITATGQWTNVGCPLMGTF